MTAYISLFLTVRFFGEKRILTRWTFIPLTDVINYFGYTFNTLLNVYLLPRL